MKRLEAICDAVAYVNGYYDPESPAYELRNPGLLSVDPEKACPSEDMDIYTCKMCCPPGPGKRRVLYCQKAAASGRRIFQHHRAGYSALIDKVQLICQSNPNSDLRLLLKLLGVDIDFQRERLLDYLSRCSNSSPSLDMPLSWFLENAGNATVTTVNSR